MAAARRALGHRHPDGLLQRRPRGRARGQRLRRRQRAARLGPARRSRAALRHAHRLPLLALVLHPRHRRGDRAAGAGASGPAIPPLLEPIDANGATRWLQHRRLPSFQPTEIAKIALVIFLAHWLSRAGKGVGSLRDGLLPFVLLVERHRRARPAGARPGHHRRPRAHRLHHVLRGRRQHLAAAADGAARSGGRGRGGGHEAVHARSA